LNHLVKPSADLNTITSTVISEVKALNKNDVIICGSAMDIARNNNIKGLSVLLQFIKNSAHECNFVKCPPKI
jgi:hypothetical protein